MTRSLVIQLARLGDLLQSMPLCHMLREEGQVHLVTSFDPGLRLRSEVDHVYVMDPARLAPVAGQPAQFLRQVRESLGGDLVGRAMDSPYDRVVCLNEDKAAIAVARLFPTRQRLGAGTPDDPCTTWLRTLAANRGANRMQLTEAMLALLPGRPSPAPAMRSPGLGDVVVHPGSGSAARQLSSTFWSTLVSHLLRRIPERRVLLSGSRSEHEFCAEIVLGLEQPERVVNTCGTTDLDGLQELLDTAALVVAQDTGVLHLAAHLLCPVIGLYHGSASVQETAPWLDGAQVFQIQAECHPCLEGQPPCGDFRCRTWLPVDAIATAAANMLEGKDDIIPLDDACRHWICRADAGGIVACAGDGEPGRDRSRQLASLRGVGGQVDEIAGRPGGRATRLQHALAVGASLAAWREVEWPRPPMGVVEDYWWRREAQAFEAGALLSTDCGSGK